MGKWINLDDLPSGRVEWDDIFDATSIDIVRCRECRYFIDNLTEDDTDEAYDACRWDWGRCIPKADDFCSYGERKESE